MNSISSDLAEEIRDQALKSWSKLFPDEEVPSLTTIEELHTWFTQEIAAHHEAATDDGHAQPVLDPAVKQEGLLHDALDSDNPEWSAPESSSSWPSRRYTHAGSGLQDARALSVATCVMEEPRSRAFWHTCCANMTAASAAARGPATAEHAQACAEGSMGTLSGCLQNSAQERLDATYTVATVAAPCVAKTACGSDSNEQKATDEHANEQLEESMTEDPLFVGRWPAQANQLMGIRSVGQYGQCKPRQYARGWSPQSRID